MNFTSIIDHTRAFNKALEDAALLTSCGEKNNEKSKIQCKIIRWSLIKFHSVSRTNYNMALKDLK